MAKITVFNRQLSKEVLSNLATPNGESSYKIYAEELAEIFAVSIQAGTIALTDGLRSYNVFKDQNICAVVDTTKETEGFYNLNTVNSFHSYIKDIYNQYRGVATKYINRYNAMFSLVFRSSKELAANLFSSLCNAGTYPWWHSVRDVKTHNLVHV